MDSLYYCSSGCYSRNPFQDERIRDVKDISAGAVLLCAITAAVIGVIVFLPKILGLFS